MFATWRPRRGGIDPAARRAEKATQVADQHGSASDRSRRRRRLATELAGWTRWSTRRAIGSTSMRCGPAGGRLPLPSTSAASTAPASSFCSARLRRLLTAVLGIGSSPGKTNLRRPRGARWGRRLDLGLRGGPRPRAAVGPQLLRAGDPSRRAQVAPGGIGNGEPSRITPMAPGGEVDFGAPRPFGAIYTLHSSCAPLGRASVAATPASASAPRELGSPARPGYGVEEEVRRPPASQPPPRTVSVHMIRPPATVASCACARSPARTMSGASVEAWSPPPLRSPRRASAARGSITARGALPPESCISPEEMFSELETRAAASSSTSPRAHPYENRRPDRDQGRRYRVAITPAAFASWSSAAMRS